MSDTTIICIVLLLIVALNIVLSFKIRRLENTFSEIISGEMLRGFSDAIRKEYDNPRLNDAIQPMSQETADEFNSQLEELNKLHQKILEEISIKANNEE